MNLSRRRIEKQRVTIAEFCECGKQNKTTKRRVCQARLTLFGKVADILFKKDKHTK
jgi:hypothetical protein